MHTPVQAAAPPGSTTVAARTCGATVRSGARLPDAYTLPFRTPPLATGSLGADGVLRYELEQRAADVEILPGLRTRLLTYAGAFPGPTLVSRTGRPTEVTARFSEA